MLGSVLNMLNLGAGREREKRRDKEAGAEMKRRGERKDGCFSFLIFPIHGQALQKIKCLSLHHTPLSYIPEPKGSAGSLKPITSGIFMGWS